MPYGDPRPSRRRALPTLGLSKITGSPRPHASPPSNPLKVGLIVAEAIEVLPRIVNPLEVTTGARLHRPDLPETAVIDVLNRDDGQEYQILVMRKPQPQPKGPESSSSR